MIPATAVRKLPAGDVAELCDRREALKAELEELDQRLKDQVEAHGFTPFGAEKSKRIEAGAWKVTLSHGETTEVRDQAVEAIKRAAPRDVFDLLFVEQIKYKLKNNASMVLAGTLPSGAPSNLRKLFAAAVVMKPKAPSLRVERIDAA